MNQEAISVFKEVMGISPTMKVIEYLLEWEGFDLTITDIARGAKISRNNAYEIISILEEKGILKQTRKIGTSRFYILNRENKITKSLSSLFENIINEDIKNE